MIDGRTESAAFRDVVVVGDLVAPPLVGADPVAKLQLSEALIARESAERGEAVLLAVHRLPVNVVLHVRRGGSLEFLLEQRGAGLCGARDRGEYAGGQKNGA